MARELTRTERRAVDALARALKAMPETLGIFFEGQGVHVYDTRLGNFEVHDDCQHDAHLIESVTPGCSYDAGGW